MVKLDLEINEIIGLAELGKIDDKKLKKFLKVASKDELEDYIVKNTLASEETEEDTTSNEDEVSETEEDIDI